jgi:hypothetical protein
VESDWTNQIEADARAVRILNVRVQGTTDLHTPPEARLTIDQHLSGWRSGRRTILVGLETPAASGNSGNGLGESPLPGAAQSGAVDADLARVVVAWPDLPDVIRRAMLALIASGRQTSL